MVYFTAFLITSALFFLSDNDRKVSSKRCVIFSGIFLFLLAALRDVSMGTDTWYYEIVFNEVKNLSFTDIVQNYERETLFFVVLSAIGKLTNSFNVAMAAVATLYVTSISLFIKKYSKNAYLSFVILLALGFYSFSLTGMRQTIAMSILMFAFRYIDEKHFWRFIALVLLATAFHNSAIIFIVAYFITNIKVDMRHIILVFGCILASIYIGAFLPDFFTIILRSEETAIETLSKLNWTGFIIQFAIMCFTMLYYEHALVDNPRNLTFYNYMFAGLCLQAFAVDYAEMFRLSMYFSVFNIALVPNVISSIRRSKERQSVEVLMTIVFMSYFYYTLMGSELSNFVFFWQSK